MSLNLFYEEVDLLSVPAIITTMGQGGRILLINDTPTVLNNIDQKSAGMNWNFPGSIRQ
jgi:hypothetical protein